MLNVVTSRKGIPFFCEKSKQAFLQDPYERYDPMVIRQTALHLADELWGSYPMQSILDFAQPYYPSSEVRDVLEIGCGVGRWIGTLAQSFPVASCWGVDFSYQMLKQAQTFWVNRNTLSIDYKKHGFETVVEVQGHELTNLQFGLAKAAQLPFTSNSQDIVVNSFLLDRLVDITKSLQEMKRVLRPNGRLLIFSPLNFQQADHWQKYYPSDKIAKQLKYLGFQLIDWQENISIREPLDAHGNTIHWKCLGIVAEKCV